jgi:hypothetical protein
MKMKIALLAGIEEGAPWVLVYEVEEKTKT